METLAPDILDIAFLDLLEALAIAEAIANETRPPLDYNLQILAEELANLTGPSSEGIGARGLDERPIVWPKDLQ